MNDEQLFRHLESQHTEAMISPKTLRQVMVFAEGEEIKLNGRSAWDAFHAYLHRSNPDIGHEPPASGSGVESGRDSHTEEGDLKSNVVNLRKRWIQQTGCACIDPPQHLPDCPGKHGVLILQDRHGPSILEVLWEEMDRLMEGLMTQSDAEDGLDRGRAQGVAYALAVFTSPSAPDIEAIRAEAVRRWNEAQSA